VVGRRAEILNGVYEATGDLYNGKPLYRKRNEHDKWLLFTTKNKWCFSSSASKDSKDGKGWCFSVQTGVDNPTQVVKWIIYANGAEDNLEEHASMKCIVHQDVMVSGVVGRKADQLNGVYEATGDLSNLKPLSRKRNDPLAGGFNLPAAAAELLSSSRRKIEMLREQQLLLREQQQQQQQQQQAAAAAAAAWQQQQQHEWRTRTHGGSQESPQWQKEPRRNCSIQ
jgi:hypothetical protein